MNAKADFLQIEFYPLSAELNQREQMQTEAIRRALVNEKLVEEDLFYRKWQSCGHSPESLPAWIRICILQEKNISQEFTNEFEFKISRASLFPLQVDSCEYSDCSSYIEQIQTEGVHALLFVAVGTYISNLTSFVYYLVQESGLLLRSEQIMRFVDSDVLGQQNQNSAKMFLCNLAKFDSNPQNLLLSLMENKNSSGENLVKRFDYNLDEVSVLSSEIIKQQQYAKDPGDKSYQSIRAEISASASHKQKEVFTFNNEPLRMQFGSKFKAKKLISVAAGFKPAVLVQNLCESECEIALKDHSGPAISYWQQLSKAEVRQTVLDLVAQEQMNLGDQDSVAKEIADSKLQDLLLQEFDQNFLKLANILQKFQKASFINCSFIEKHEEIVSEISIGWKSLFWHSNAWRANGIYFFYTPEELEENYKDLLRRSAKKLGLPVWRYKYGFGAIFGEDVQNPHTIFVDHQYYSNEINRSDYEFFYEN